MVQLVGFLSTMGDWAVFLPLGSGPSSSPGQYWHLGSKLGVKIIQFLYVSALKFIEKE